MFGIKVGDQVVILETKDYGRIGTVESKQHGYYNVTFMNPEHVATVPFRRHQIKKWSK